MADSVETSAADVSPYLKQVRVRDYPPLRDTEVDFKPGLNIIIGKNGSGKTRFLSLVRNLATPFQPQTEGAKCELTIFYEKEAKISFSLPTNRFNTDDFRPEDTFLQVKVDSAGESAIASNLDDAFYKATKLDLKYEAVLAKHGNPLQFLPIIESAESLVLYRNGSVRSLYPGPGDYLFERSLFAGLLSYGITRVWGTRPHAEQVATSQHELASIAKKLINQVVDFFLEQLVQTIGHYSPIKDIRLNPALQIYPNESQDELLINGFVLEYKVSGNWLPFNALSDGTKRLFYLISQVITQPIGTIGIKRPNVSLEVSDRDKIIFLEEPELGIHPHQLHKLLSLIREVSREHQVILTTHAPQVLDMLGADELDRITICSLDPEKGTQFHKLTEEKQEQARTYMKEVGFLSDYWRYSYLEETEAE